MAGSFSKEALSRRMRNLGNVNKIPSKHPDGNKPSFAGGGPTGRAASSQQASGGGFIHGTPYQQGAPPATGQRPSPPKPNPHPETGFFPPAEQQANRARLKTSTPFGLPAIARRMSAK